MEKDKKGPIGEVHISGDIFLSMEQLDAIVWFYGKETPLADVISSITGMPEETREMFMDELVYRYNNPPKSSDNPT